MANMTMVPNSLRLAAQQRAQADTRKNWIRFLLVAAVIVAVSWATSIVWGMVWGMVALVAIALAAVLMPLQERLDPILLSGAQGEDRAAAALRTLPSTYTVYNQVVVRRNTTGPGCAEADFVVVGPKCIFVIEVKNIHGVVYVSDSSPTWEVRKISRGGQEHASTMRSPILQVSKNMRLLAALLNRSGVRVWVQPIVVFTHPNAGLAKLEPLTAPVIKVEELTSYMGAFTPGWAATATAMSKARAQIERMPRMGEADS